jgi:hypothetical protein
LFENDHLSLVDPSDVLRQGVVLGDFRGSAARCKKGKVNLARQRMPIARDRSLGNRLANRISLPLLEIEKRRLFLQLARELP